MNLVVAFSTVNLVVAIATVQLAAFVISPHDVVECVAGPHCALDCVGPYVEVFDVSTQDVIDGGDDFIGTLPRNLLHDIAKVVDVVGVVATPARHGIRTLATVKNVVFDDHWLRAGQGIPMRVPVRIAGGCVHRDHDVVAAHAVMAIGAPQTTHDVAVRRAKQGREVLRHQFSPFHALQYRERDIVVSTAISVEFQQRVVTGFHNVEMPRLERIGAVVVAGAVLHQVADIEFFATPARDEVGDFHGAGGNVDNVVPRAVQIELHRPLLLGLVLLGRQHKGVFTAAATQRQLQHPVGFEPVIAVPTGKHRRRNAIVRIAWFMGTDFQLVVTRPALQRQINSPETTVSPGRYLQAVVIRTAIELVIDTVGLANVLQSITIGIRAQ